LIRQAFLSALRNPFRSLLTIIGLTVGVTAFGASLVTAFGASRGLWIELQEMVENVIEIHWTYADMGNKVLSRPPKNLGPEDVESLKTIPGVESVFPVVVRVRAKVRYGQAALDPRLECIPASDHEVRYFQLTRGRPFIPSEQMGYQKACYIGREVNDKLFKARNPLGELLYVNGIPFTIVGVLKSKPDFLNRNYNYRVVIPLSQAREVTSFNGVFDIIMADISGAKDAPAIAGEMDRRLLQAHGLKNYHIVIPEEIFQKRLRIFNGIISVVVIFSFFCLFVSGVGIMNVLLFSIKERSREIGIRLACGSPPGIIFLLITFESIILCLAGGLMGCLLAYPMALGLGRLVSLFIVDAARLSPEFSPLSLLAAFGVALVTGIISGAYPSYVASQLEPAECLRK